MNKLYDELKRLDVIGTDTDPQFLFGLDLAYCASPYGIGVPVGLLWATVSADRFLPPVMNEIKGCFEAPDQNLFVNNRRYINKRYVTMTSKYGRKLCNRGSIWGFGRDLSGRELYLMFGLGYELFGAQCFAVRLQPVIIQPEDMLQRYEGHTLQIPMCGIEIHGFGDEMPRRDGTTPMREQISIEVDWPLPNGYGWHPVFHHMGDGDTDTRYETFALQSRLTDEYGCRCLAIENVIQIPVCHIDRCLF